MGPDQVCRKKDKRLLVLFAFGVMILLWDLEIPSHTHFTPGVHHSWLEIRGNDHRLFRYSPVGQSMETVAEKILADLNTSSVIMEQACLDSLAKEEKVTALDSSRGNEALPAAVSPRLAFLLGQPFSVNLANAGELALVPGIGPILAGNIIAHRDAHGPLTSAHRLEDVRGIGPRMKQRLQHYFTYAHDDK
ncbi:MAG: helix-hairpin-helix domain-containing protein [Desulfobulbaceae bacterium]|nr:helix-hairpin-helix domain-containing protein [Desulfobulbaceae bacterium]